MSNANSINVELLLNNYYSKFVNTTKSTALQITKNVNSLTVEPNKNYFISSFANYNTLSSFYLYFNDENIEDDVYYNTNIYIHNNFYESYEDELTVNTAYVGSDQDVHVYTNGQFNHLKSMTRIKVEWVGKNIIVNCLASFFFNNFFYWWWHLWWYTFKLISTTRYPGAVAVSFTPADNTAYNWQNIIYLPASGELSWDVPKDSSNSGMFANELYARFSIIDHNTQTPIDPLDLVERHTHDGDNYENEDVFGSIFTEGAFGSLKIDGAPPDDGVIPSWLVFNVHSKTEGNIAAYIGTATDFPMDYEYTRNPAIDLINDCITENVYKNGPGDASNAVLIGGCNFVRGTVIEREYRGTIMGRTYTFKERVFLNVHGTYGT